jgi:Neutral/alkaline non-lysosomal ceramidase, C-terminal
MGVVSLSVAGSAFGKVLQDAGKGPWVANQTVTVTFQSACPRNSLGRRGSFLTVERLAEGSSTGWDVVRPLLHHLYWIIPFAWSAQSPFASTAHCQLSVDRLQSRWQQTTTWRRSSRGSGRTCCRQSPRPQSAGRCRTARSREPTGCGTSGTPKACSAASVPSAAPQVGRCSVQPRMGCA